MGALNGLRGIELAGKGPGPFCAALLLDHGAEVVRVAAPTRSSFPALGGAKEPMNGGRTEIELDLKKPVDVCAFLDLVEDADFLIEGFRPGVTERLGVGPDVCHARNPRLVYARITGWGQSGPLAARAGHDINYIGLTGALHAIGTAEEPIVPLNLVGDYAGGAMFAAFGILAAILERQSSGVGQVVDASIVDGVGYMMAPFHELMAGGAWHSQRVSNMLDGGMPFYSVYGTLDGEHMSVGALEPQFYAQLCLGLGVNDEPVFADQLARHQWPAMRERLHHLFATRTRDEWSDIFFSLDACVAPVLALDEVGAHRHHRSRTTYTTSRSGAHSPSAAPVFSRTPGARFSGAHDSEPVEPRATGSTTAVQRSGAGI